MRNSVLSIFLILATAYAMPVAAQDYQKVQSGELNRLRQQDDTELRKLRAGDGKVHVSLSQAERDRIEKMTGGHILQVQRLGDLKGGGHGHVHWGVWVGIPCACGGVTALVLLILLFL